MASVARKGETLRVTSSPLTAPIANPIAIDRPAISGTSASTPLKPVVITAAVAIIDATDRSRPRTRMTKVWPMTTIARGENCRSRLEMFWAPMKFGETAPPNRTMAARKT